jgi:sulfatase-like protein
MRLMTTTLTAAATAVWTAGSVVADDFQIPLFGSSGPQLEGGAKRPNIVFILTDDQDVRMNSLDHVPLIQKRLIDEGTLFKRHYCTTAVCCPSRASLWTGKLAHNTNVTDLNPPYGTSSLFS